MPSVVASWTGNSNIAILIWLIHVRFLVNIIGINTMPRNIWPWQRQWWYFRAKEIYYKRSWRTKQRNSKSAGDHNIAFDCSIVSLLQSTFSCNAFSFLHKAAVISCFVTMNTIQYQLRLCTDVLICLLTVVWRLLTLKYTEVDSRRRWCCNRGVPHYILYIFIYYTLLYIVY